METPKEVTVYTNGDSSKLSTWSNVPFLFTETLMQKGINVNRVDLSPSPVLNKFWNKTFGRVLRRVYKNTDYDYFRSLVHFLDVRRRIKRAINQYANSEANIFLTFSFSSVGLAQKPSIQFCDWTYDYYFKRFISRKPDMLEKWCINREDSQIEGTDLVLPLYPVVAEYMKSRYKNKNIIYLGNVINSHVCDITESQAWNPSHTQTNCFLLEAENI
jgi:hypothetical protein